MVDQGSHCAADSEVVFVNRLKRRFVFIYSVQGGPICPN
ncbi:hypothetical protein BCEP4_140042 [Burkholderia cepacia]|nr:hypothetical protein BCEP4_140042 [Burkholderia cepacia]